MSRLNSWLRAEKALELRGRGRTWQEIADALGFRSRGAAQLAVTRHAKRTALESGSPETTRRYLLEQARYDTRALENGMTAAVERGDDENVQRYAATRVKVRDQVARLTGAYEPERTEVNITVGQSIEANRQRLLELTEAKAALPPRPSVRCR